MSCLNKHRQTNQGPGNPKPLNQTLPVFEVNYLGTSSLEMNNGAILNHQSFSSNWLLPLLMLHTIFFGIQRTFLELPIRSFFVINTLLRPCQAPTWHSKPNCYLGSLWNPIRSLTLHTLYVTLNLVFPSVSLVRIHTCSQVHMCRTHLVTGTVLYSSSLCDPSTPACRQLKHAGRDEKSQRVRPIRVA